MGISTIIDVAESLYPERVLFGSRDRSGVTAARFAQLMRSGASDLSGREIGTVAFIGVTSVAFPLTLFACAEANIPFVPLNYRLPLAQLARLLGQLDRPLVICDPQYAALRSHVPSSLLVSSDDWVARCATTATGADLRSATDRDVAALLFTSGTTAEPKCATLRHGNLESYVYRTVDPGSAAEEDAALISVPPYHIAGIASVLTNAFAGRRVIYLPNFTADKWIATVEEQHVTFAMVVPTMLAKINEALEHDARKLQSLRSIASGGAPMPLSVITRAMSLLPQVAFVNSYGLTETSSTIAILTAEDHRQAAISSDPGMRARLGSVGRVIPGIEAAIRDDAGGLLPSGSVGELWVRGPQVSGEYVNGNSALDKGGWFRTRDLAALDSDGYLYLKGRADDVIIRGGENVAPAEIEETLLQHPDVGDAAVVGIPDEEWGQRIVAVVVPKAASLVDASAIQEWCRERLRSAKTPDEIVIRETITRTDTGKIIRRAIADDIVRADTEQGSR